MFHYISTLSPKLLAKMSLVCCHLAVSIPYPPLVNILNAACPALGGVQSLTQRAVSLGIRYFGFSKFMTNDAYDIEI